ncbi:hypothetical protein CVD28_02675 [Bacillus sp. M6-12]|uniref:hypothetical protein n=1 Tax=Bacillus sp. M6-12 TaxID=2054166 RepID=UPI000C783F2B|nr:hypothetical protein [Bacillus sp. M6-12]PLS19337.1 hypothetical protein CVD28_02675 [Bacillus sp. M6-12]
MERFLKRLAEKKYNLYRALFIDVPQPKTNQEYLQRIENQTRYEEVLDIIDWLPEEQKKVVEERFEFLKVSFADYYGEDKPLLGRV